MSPAKPRKRRPTTAAIVAGPITLRDFALRFGLSGPTEQARIWFVARLNNLVLHSQAIAGAKDGYDLDTYAYGLANHLGIRYDTSRASLARYTAGSAVGAFLPADFSTFLAALEYLVHALPRAQGTALAEFITQAIREAPGDLLIRWESGRFYPSGAELLDEDLVSSPLLWLRQKVPAAAPAIERALDSLLAGQQHPERLRSVITDSYEALETAAKHYCGNTRDLSANRDLLIRRARLNDLMAHLLREYVRFGNRYRHGATEAIADPSYSDAEAFLYSTGILLRLVSTSSIEPAPAVVE